MEASELRLGNYILHEGKFVKVVSLDWDLEDECEPLIKVDTFEYEKNSIGGSWRKYIELNYTHFKPIPLTEEWLLKFGYDKRYHTDSNHCYYNNEHDLVLFLQSRTRVIYDPYVQIGHKTINLNYVNQLQNLHFALTGEELEIKHATTN